MMPKQIKKITPNKTVTYARICANFQQQQKGSNHRAQIEIGGKILHIPGDLREK